MSESEDAFFDRSLQRAKQLDALCDEFETRYLDGKRPDIESFLLRVDGPDKQPLLLELIAIEIHSRRHFQAPATPAQLLHLKVMLVNLSRCALE